MIEQISALLEEAYLIAYVTTNKQTIILETKLENVETRNQTCSQKPSS